jgi:hypothetical protein
MPPVIDWAAHPEPWRTIGPAFRKMCEDIVAAPLNRSPLANASSIGARRNRIERALGVKIEVSPPERA